MLHLNPACRDSVGFVLLLLLHVHHRCKVDSFHQVFEFALVPAGRLGGLFALSQSSGSLLSAYARWRLRLSLFTGFGFQHLVDGAKGLFQLNSEFIKQSADALVFPPNNALKLCRNMAQTDRTDRARDTFDAMHRA